MITTRESKKEALHRKSPGHLPDTLLAGLSSFIHTHTGLHFPRERWKDLERHMRAAARDFAFNDLEQCVEWLLQSSPSQEQIDILAGCLTIGETFFFRDKVVFQLLAEKIFPDLLHSGYGGTKSLRIWSAGCCTGEEPYSLAILLDQMADQWSGWSVEIVGTDLNPRFLELARDGVYTRWSLRAADDALISQYFKKSGHNRFEIIPKIKRMVRFLPFNLAAGPGPQDFHPGLATCHLILCRNVLLYLSPEMIDRVVERLASGLADGGWLIVSPSETAFVRSQNLAVVHFPGAILHRKELLAQPSVKPTARFGSLIRQEGGATTGCAAPQSDRWGVHSPSLPRTAIDHSAASSLPHTGGQSRRHRTHIDELGAGSDNPFKRAVTLYEQNNYEEAANIMEALLTAGKGQSDSPAKPDCLMLLARSLANLGRLTDARQWCEQAVAAAQLNAEGHYLLATIYQEAGMMRESLEALKKTVYLAPRFVMAYVNLANVARLQGRAEEAQRHFAGAVSLLEGMDAEELVPHSDGMTALSLKQALKQMMKQ